MRRNFELNRSMHFLAVWLPVGLALAGCLSLAGCDSKAPAPATPPSAGSAAHGGLGNPGGSHDAVDESAEDSSEFAAGKKVFRAQCARCHSIGNQMAGGPGQGGPGGPSGGPSPGGPGAGGPGPGSPGGPPGGPGGRGPNLSKVGANPDHTVEWLVGYIRDPKSVKENSRMPAQGKLGDADIQAVAEYLASLK